MQKLVTHTNVHTHYYVYNAHTTVCAHGLVAVRGTTLLQYISQYIWKKLSNALQKKTIFLCE